MVVFRSGVAARSGVLVVVVLLAGCGGVGASGSPPTAAATAAATATTALLPPGPLLTTDDLDELLPGLSDDASLRPLWQEWGGDQAELRLLRARCGADTAAAEPLDPSAPSAHDAEQWLQGTQPQYAILDVLRWSPGETGGPQDWLDDEVEAESPCRGALVLPHQPGADGGPEVVAVVRRWEQPTTGGTPGNEPLPLWQVGGFAVDGSTAIAVRVGAYSARSAREAWVRAQPGVSAVVARAAQRASAPAAAASSSS